VVELAKEPETGLWRFSARTLASIPELATALEEEAEQEEEATHAEREVDPARRSPRATMKTFLEAMTAEPQRIDEAVKCLDDSEEDAKGWEIRGRDLAEKLIRTMDRISRVDLPFVPDKPDGDPYAWHTSPAGNIVIGPVAKDEFKGEWRFTPQTIRTLDALYEVHKRKPIVQELQKAGKKEHVPLRLWIGSKMPESLSGPFLFLRQWQWIALGVLVVVGYLTQRLVAAGATALMGVWLRRLRLDLGPDVRRRAFRPFGVVAMAVLWYAGLHLLELPGGLLAVLVPAFKLIFAVGVVWLVYSLVDVLGGYIASKKEVRLTHFDDLLIPILCKMLKVLVTLFGVLFVVTAMGCEWKTVLATLGIGGLAIAMAARDTLANFFGSVTVLFDRPFRIGDWIVIGDIEGTVEHVGFRSTRVRTFYNSVISIPNSRVVDTQVDNYGLRQYRRAKVMISIAYSTPPDKIEAFCEGIRELVRLHPYTRKDYYHVYLNQFAASSLDILLYAFFRAPDWATELRERHRLFLDIVRLADQLGVELAFPTQTVYLERTRGPDRAPEPKEAGDPYTLGQDYAARVFTEAHGEGPVQIPPVVIETAPKSQRGKPTARSASDGRQDRPR
ncbi:MAG: mechanosensitive ion channel family protein, partial [Planctomycetota bacterium]